MHRFDSFHLHLVSALVVYARCDGRMGQNSAVLTGSLARGALMAPRNSDGHRRGVVGGFLCKGVSC